MANTTSIRIKLIRMIMLVSLIIALAICSAFFLYEYFSFRERTIQKVSTYGQIIAINSTAALAFESKEEGQEILSALKAEPQIVAAAIYDSKGKLFCRYPAGQDTKLPLKPGGMGFAYTNSFLEGFQPIMKDKKQLGSLYLRSDLQAMYSRFGMYGFVLILVLIFALSLSFVLSRFLQSRISEPILALAKTAKAVSERKDYSVRAAQAGGDEVGALTEAFNQMLTEIQGQTERLNSFNHNLEQMVRERTVELEAANSELEAFSYSVSHDLRAPIRAIHGYIHIFMEDYGHSFNGEGHRLLERVISNGQKMGVLIDDLLAFSQLGRKELIKNNLQMHSLVKGTWEELLPENGRNIKLVLHPLPDAFAEKSTMVQVWTNLISNALKYTSNTQETVIDISGRQEAHGVTYCIKDNGTGFDMQYYNKLFGVFQRLHSQEEFEGTGVGLAIVERIIKKHGGKIWAEGKVDEGAAFYFFIPNAGR